MTPVAMLAMGRGSKSTRSGEGGWAELGGWFQESQVITSIVFLLMFRQIFTDTGDGALGHHLPNCRDSSDPKIMPMKPVGLTSTSRGAAWSISNPEPPGGGSGYQ